MEPRPPAESTHFHTKKRSHDADPSDTSSSISARSEALSNFVRKRRGRSANAAEQAAASASCDASDTTEKLTEMEKQVVSLQRQHADMLLLFECGYRVRMFGADAETAARVLGIRAQRHRAFVEASVPVHRTLFHSRRLVLAGMKVGIVKQLSTAVRTNGQPLERGVVQVFTRATIPCSDEGSDPAVDSEQSGEDRGADSGRFIFSIVEETVHSTRLFAHLVHKIAPEDRLCIPMEPVRIGLCGHDIHTGESVFDEFVDDAKRSRLREVLEQVMPVEFVVPNGGLTPSTEMILLAYARHPVDTAAQSAARGICRVERVNFDDHVWTTPSSSPQPVLPALARLCLSAINAYLNSLMLESALSLDSLPMASTTRLLSDRTVNRLRLSPAAFRDLSIFSETSDDVVSVFSILNHTQTNFGARRLRDWIRFPLMDVDEIEGRQDCIAFLADVGRDGAIISETLRSDVLPSAAPIERLLQQLHLRRASPRNVAVLLQALTTAESHIMQINNGGRGSQGLKLRSRNLLLEYPQNRAAIQAVIDDLDVDAALANNVEKAIAKQWTRYPRGKVEYEAICTDLEALEVKFAQVLDQCRRLLDLPTLEYCSHRAGGHGKVFGYLVGIDRSKIAAVPEDWIVVTSSKAVVRYYPREVRTLQMDQDILLERKMQLIEATWREILASIDSAVYTAGMAAVDILADLDALSSLATAVRLYPGYVRPTFSSVGPEERNLTIFRGRHPVLELEATRGSSYIAGDVNLSGCGAALVVSGPNMGGKSTLLRMTALLTIFAQIGMFVPADSMTLRCFDSIQTRMHRASHSSAGTDELQQLAVISSTATPLTLVLLDEVGFGLTIRQARTLAFCTVKYLLKSIGCCVLMATHMADVARRLQEEDDASGARVVVQELAHEVAVPLYESKQSGDAGVVYHYTARDGVARQSFAFEAAAMAGIPKEILDAVAASQATQHKNQEPHIY